MEIIEAGIPKTDGCPILTRLAAFIATQGVRVSLQNTVRDRNGNPKDLSAYFVTSESDSDDDGDVDNQGAVVLRVKEWLGSGGCGNPIWEFTGEVVDAAAGLVKCALAQRVVDNSGIYELSWGVKNASGELVYATQGLLSVERSLFGSDDALLKNQGPPTINEIRMWMMDSSPKENFLLRDVEFKDEQIMLALSWPVQRWNEALPPIKKFNTRNFPFRGAWAAATMAKLYEMAAANYRRNRLNTAAGGLTVDDKNKEREYLEESKRLLEEYDDWVRGRKYAMNVAMVAGNMSSEYSRAGSRFGW